jgi:CubicO group peptidase (beta-lactamase class C family)
MLLLGGVRRKARRYAPGTRWSYSNTNYKPLALIA